jgi:hypothetical protein
MNYNSHKEKQNGKKDQRALQVEAGRYNQKS